jgi:hypothetical protein
MDAIKDGSTRSVGGAMRCTKESFTGAKFSRQVSALDDFRYDMRKNAAIAPANAD